MLRTENLIHLNTLIFLTAFVIGSQTETPDFQNILNRDQNESTRKAKSKEMLQYINKNVNPCEDFYEYACGNWFAKQYDAEVITATSALDTKVEENLQQLLEEPVTLDDGLNGRKVKDFYKSCVNIEQNGITQQDFFSEFIEGNGGFPAVPGLTWQAHNYKWQEVVANLRHEYGMDILIGLTVDVNYQNPIENSIYLEEPTTLIPPALCSREGTKRVDIRDYAYTEVERKVAETLSRWLSMTLVSAKALAADLISFENELCAAIERTREVRVLRPDMGLDLNYTRKTAFEFSHQFNDVIDFERYIAVSFGHPFGKPIFMRSAAYFAQLSKTISQRPIQTVANYIMYRALSYLAFPLDDNSHKRTKFCIGQLRKYYSKHLGKMYYRKFGSQNAKADIETIFEDIRQSLELSLNSKWIEDSSRRKSTEKLKVIKVKFPDYENIPTDDTQIKVADYWHNLQQLMKLMQKREFTRLYERSSFTAPQPSDPIESYDKDLKYRPLNKQLDIAWGVLRAPIYQSSYPTSLRYSTIGVRLARELSHAFDRHNWNASIGGLTAWDRFTSYEYLNRASCFRQQLSNYLYDKPDQFRNEVQLDELIASSNGLNVAFNAYLRWLSYKSPNNDYPILIKETLPGLNFSNTQLFFLSFAQMSCRAKSRNRAPPPSFMPLQSHTVERYAINGPLRNSIEFAREFNCQPGSSMNPNDKCVIF